MIASNFEDEPAGDSAGKLLREDQARRIAANIAKHYFFSALIYINANPPRLRGCNALSGTAELLMPRFALLTTLCWSDTPSPEPPSPRPE